MAFSAQRGCICGAERVKFRLPLIMEFPAVFQRHRVIMLAGDLHTAFKNRQDMQDGLRMRRARCQDKVREQPDRVPRPSSIIDSRLDKIHRAMHSIIVSNKQIVEDLLQRIPENASFRDIVREIEFVNAVREGFAELDRGERIPIEEVERELPSWIIK